MGTRPPEVRHERIEDHETARRGVEVRAITRQLQQGGLSSGEASNLTAHLVGLAPAKTGWNLRQVEHLLFLRSIVESGRLQP